MLGDPTPQAASPHSLPIPLYRCYLLLFYMGSDPTKGIQTLPDLFRTTTGIMLSDAAVLVGSSPYTTGLARDFLLKKLRYHIHLEDFPAAQALLFGFCRGDMTTAEIIEVLATQLPDPEDFQQWDDFAQTNGIFWETLRMIRGNENTDVGSAAGVSNETISMGGGKGIPLEAGHGIQMFVFNGASTTVGETTSELWGSWQLVGVFMEGSN